jgi:hypothetical protein
VLACLTLSAGCSNPGNSTFLQNLFIDPTTLPKYEQTRPVQFSYARASSRVDKNDRSRFIDWDKNPSNPAQSIPGELSPPPGQLSLIVVPDRQAIYTPLHPVKGEPAHYLGVTFYLVNKTDKEKRFIASAYRLNMFAQALNQQGQWQDIELMSTSIGCALSGHALFLKPNMCWQFTAPRYTGSFHTKARLVFAPGYNKSQEGWIISEPYDVTINPGQFHDQPNTPTVITPPPAHP